MNLPTHIREYISELDTFIEQEILPLQNSDDNQRFFDHRREDSRTNWDDRGLPTAEWEALLREMRRRADAAGHFRYALPAEFGGRDGTHLAMAAIREHLAHRGLGLHNDLQNESSIVGNIPQVLMFRDFGSEEQKQEFVPAILEGRARIAFGLTEPEHGSDATWMETTAKPEVRDGKSGWLINGEKTWNTGIHVANYDMIFARTSGVVGKHRGITCFLVPTSAPGFEVLEYLWTLNMPTDHAHIRLQDVWVEDTAILGGEGNGLQVAGHFLHENRIRQAASSLGAAQYCIDQSVKYARERKPFGKPLSINQGVQFPLVELHTEAAMLRQLIYAVADEMDRIPKPEISRKFSDKVAMCNYRANRLCCDAADRAMQIHGGLGYSRHMPFEHIYRHHRRYRITEGAEEIQMRRVAQILFGFGQPA